MNNTGIIMHFEYHNEESSSVQHNCTKRWGTD